MKPKTEELLLFLLYSSDMLMRPTLRNLTDSYESWAYRNGFLRQLTRLEKLKLIESDPGSTDERIVRLTEAGRLHALGGTDPEARWSRPWDGMWRLVLFDLPRGQNAHRERLWRYLRNNRFGLLQNSVWITPDPLREERDLLSGDRINVESLLLMEARPCANESDAEIVDGAWDFKRVNHRYARHLKVMEKRPTGSLRDGATARALRRWAAEEREAWLDAMSIDPLLPECLLPRDYLGRDAWNRRKEVFRQAGQQLKTFEP
jgi:phenylacetic acid degradation operon negative regulatory protein